MYAAADSNKKKLFREIKNDVSKEFLFNNSETIGMIFNMRSRFVMSL